MRLRHPNRVVIQEFLEHFPGKTKNEYIKTKKVLLSKKNGITREQIKHFIYINDFDLFIAIFISRTRGFGVLAAHRLFWQIQKISPLCASFVIFIAKLPTSFTCLLIFFSEIPQLNLVLLILVFF